jgi:hypothetical protein
MPVSCLTTYIWDYRGRQHVYTLVIIPDDEKDKRFRRIGLLETEKLSVDLVDTDQ